MTIWSLLSCSYIFMLMQFWRMLLRQLMPLALSLALDSAGSNMLAKMAMIAITTSNSISVKAGDIRRDTIDGLEYVLASLGEFMS